MPGRRGFAIEDQRESSSFRFEEGRGVIVAIKVCAGQKFNAEKLCVVVALQRIGRDGRPTQDEVISEELSYGKLSKFHPGFAKDAHDENPQDMGPDGEGNCIYTVDDAYPDPKAKACVWSKSLELAGVPAMLLNGYVPNLLGLDAQWTRDVVKYAGLMNDKGQESEGSNLIVRKGDGNILNLGEIIKRAAGRGAGQTAPTATISGVAASAGSAPTASPSVPSASATGDSLEDEIDGKARELLQAFEGKAEVKLQWADIVKKLVRLLVTGKVSAKLHRGIQEKFKDKEWFNSHAEALGWALDGDTITIPAVE